MLAGSVGTFCVEFDASTLEFEGAELTGDLVDSGDDDGVGELDHASAIDADEVVVLFVGDEFGVVSRLPVSEAPGVGESVFDEELHGAIDGCVSDPGDVFSYLDEELVYGDVSIEGEEGLDDDISLPGGLEPELS